jgi:uncharacterized membrane protein
MRSARSLAAASALLALVMVAVYLWVINWQDGEVAIWFVSGLALAALLAATGAVLASRPVLIVAGVLLLALGFLGILSIGLPIVAAGVLAILAAVRTRVVAR